MLAHVIFDLDGTLIDSADSILAGFRTVLDEAGILAVRSIGPQVIGPPLRETLRQLAGSDDPALVDRLARRFAAWYDSEGFRRTRVYPGVPELLQTLHRAGLNLHIVTNKRLLPTLRILDWTGWRPLFGCIDTQDAKPEAPLASKAAVLARLLAQIDGGAANSIYVGDRRDDLEAATDNRLPCILVAWGYGSQDAPANGQGAAAAPLRIAATPAELASWLTAR